MQVVVPIAFTTKNTRFLQYLYSYTVRMYLDIYAVARLYEFGIKSEHSNVGRITLHIILESSEEGVE
jgi:hypothetical protein